LLGFLPEDIYQTPHWEAEPKHSTDDKDFSEMRTHRMEFKLAKAAGTCLIEYWRIMSYTEKRAPKI
jgi:hypothetical protein